MTVVYLEHERINRGLTRKEFAEELGVTRHILARLESGKRVSVANAKTIADHLQIEVTDLAPFAPNTDDAPTRAAAAAERAGTSEIKERVR